MQHINPEHKPVLRRRLNSVEKREQMSEQQRYEYVLRAQKKNRLQREFAGALVDGDQEQLLDLAQQKRELEAQEAASSIAQMRFPKSVFDRWCAETPPRAATELDSLIWVCDECKITIMPSVVTHGYIRGNCLCQKRKTEERLNKEGEARSEELRRQEMVNMFKKVGRYNWLAPQFRLENNTFDDLKMDRVKPVYRDNVLYALNYARHFIEDPRSNTIVYGPSGSGKTLIFTALLNAWCETGKSGLYANAIDLFAVIDSLRQKDADTMDLENKMKWCDLLVIDEVDRVKLTDARFGVYYRVINYRSQKEMETPGSAPTILICNATIRNNESAAFDLETHIGTPTVSRIQVGLNPIFVPGEDQRAKER